MSAPRLSVVVVIVSDTTDSRAGVSHLAKNLQALTPQLEPGSLEVIVPHHRQVEGIADLQRRFPDVVFVPVDELRAFTGRGGSREHHDELRARGLAVAQGDVIGLLEDHARPDPQWCANAIAAHRQDYAGVGGAIENGVDRPLNWAVYFCDFGRYQNPVSAGESPFASDANVTYKRSALESIRPTWQATFQETAVNEALRSRGERLALSPELVVTQHRDDLRLGAALRERFVWGRSYAATRSRLVGAARRALYAALSPVLPGLLLLRMARNVQRKGRCRGAFVRAFPLTALLTAAWCWGELIGYLSGRTGASGAPEA
jgi:hypothetical protein